MPKLAIDPRSSFSSAPTAARAAYITLIVTAALVMADGVFGGRAIHLFADSPWSILWGILVGYLIADSGLLLLRARALGRTLAYIIAVGLIVLAGLLTVGPMADGIATVISGVVLTLLSVGLVGCVATAQRKGFFSSKPPSMFSRSRRDRATRIQPGTSQPAPGSWEAIKAAQAKSNATDQ
jgi:peptidoglycan/LPS O-acetylase OafA/YrhL